MAQLQNIFPILRSCCKKLECPLYTPIYVKKVHGISLSFLAVSALISFVLLLDFLSLNFTIKEFIVFQTLY